eukprot:g1325.t1
MAEAALDAAFDASSNRLLLAALRELPAALASDDAQLTSEQLERAARLLLVCARRHGHSKLHRKLIGRVVQRLAGSANFPSALIAKLKHDTTIGCQDVPEWLDSLVQVIFALFRSAASAARTKRAAAGKRLVKALRAKPQCVAPIVALATAEPAKDSSPPFETIYWLLAHCRGLDSYEEQLKPMFLQAYLRDVVSCKTVAPLQTLAQYSPLLASLSHTELAGQIQDALQRQMKKNAETVAVAAVLAEHVKLDLSRYAAEVFLPMFLAQVKATDEHCQSCSLKLLQHLVVKCDTEAAVEVAKQVQAAMEGGTVSQVAHKLGLVRAFEAIRAGLAPKGLSAISAVADIALDALHQFAAKEKIAEAKQCGIDCMAQWYRLADKPADKYLDFLIKGVESKEKSAKQMFLSAMLQVSASPTLSERGADVFKTLSDIATEADKKTLSVSSSAPLEAVAAVAILMKLQSASMDVEKRLAGSKLLKVFSKKASFLYHQSLLALRSGGDTAILVGLAEALALAATHHEVKKLVLQHKFFEAAEKPQASRAPPPLCVGLAELLLHPSHDVRRSAIAAVKSVQSGTPELVYPMLLAFRNRVVGTKHSAVVHRTVLVQAVKALVPESAPIELLPTALLLAHHPLLNPRTKKRWHDDTYNAIWQALCDSSFGGAAKVSEALATAEEAGESVRGALMAELMSASGREQEGAWSALASLMELPGDGGRLLVVNAIFKEVCDGLRQPALTNLTARDIGIWATPEGVLYNPDAGGSGYHAAVGYSSANVRRMRTGKRQGLYSAEDEAWEAEVRAELEAKKAKKAAAEAPAAAAKPAKSSTAKPGAKSKKKKKDDTELLFPLEKTKKGKKASASKPKAAAAAKPKAKKLPDKKESREEREKRERIESESATRAQVDALITNAEKWLQVLTAAAKAVPLIFNEQLPEMLPVVLGLLDCESAIVQECAYECLKQLSLTIDPCIQDIAADIAAALRLVKTKPSSDLKQYGALLERLFEDLVPVCSLVEQEYGAMPLPATSFHVLFPVCKAVCTASDLPADIHSGAFGVMGMHAAFKELEDDELAVLRKLRRPMVEAALHLLAASPKLEPAPDRVLAGLVDGPKLSVAEWGPLLGDGGLLSKHGHVRFAVLRSLMLIVSRGGELPMATNPLLSSRVWFAQFDEDEQNQKVATTIWDHTGAELSSRYATPLLALLGHAEKTVRDASARALANAVLEHPSTSKSFLEKLVKVANGGSQGGKVVVPEVGDDGFPLSPSEIERIRQRLEEEMATKLVAPRLGVAATLRTLGEEKALEETPEDDLRFIFQFLVDIGLVTSNDEVRAAMSVGGMALIDSYGAEFMDMLLPLFEKYMATVESADATADDLNASKCRWWSVFMGALFVLLKRACAPAGDWRKQGLVVFLGTMAKHLDKEDSRVPAAINTLIATLGTPSEEVQKSVATCLAPLIPAVRDQAPTLLSKLMEQTISGETYGDRRGGAYGVSAVIKGLGIVALKKNDIIPQLQEACKGKGGNPRQVGAAETSRESYCAPHDRTACPVVKGALFAFECLSSRLGLLFEPYVIDIVPILLKSFSDSSSSVRSAADGTARAIMKNLSAHGVKLVLPSLLSSLNDPQWRTKQAAIQLLGSMAYCAPRQLSSCLPQIVPKLTDAFTDTHPKVREAGKASLSDIASVVGCLFLQFSL